MPGENLWSRGFGSVMNCWADPVQINSGDLCECKRVEYVCQKNITWQIVGSMKCSLANGFVLSNRADQNHTWIRWQFLYESPRWYPMFATVYEFVAASRKIHRSSSVNSYKVRRWIEYSPLLTMNRTPTSSVFEEQSPSKGSTLLSRSKQFGERASMAWNWPRAQKIRILPEIVFVLNEMVKWWATKQAPRGNVANHLRFRICVGIQRYKWSKRIILRDVRRFSSPKRQPFSLNVLSLLMQQRIKCLLSYLS